MHAISAVDFERCARFEEQLGGRMIRLFHPTTSEQELWEQRSKSTVSNRWLR